MGVWRRELAVGETTDMYATYVAKDMVSITDLLDPGEGLFSGRVDCYRMLFKSFHHPLMSSDPLVQEQRDVVQDTLTSPPFTPM